ncbi:hypothetical protein QL285_049211 [Trifolium repens]|nr:hypothetical protein QL285_049211 [Trifolium repens]
MAFERKGFHHFSFKVPKVEGLLAMEKRLTAISRPNFETNYGFILNLLHVTVNITALTTLAQFFDSPLRCFTFQDFQLLPTLEEFEVILGRSMEGRACYVREIPTEKDIAMALHLEKEEVSSLREFRDIEGFSKRALKAKAQEKLSVGNWKAHNAILALLIYGLILFPSYDYFIDMSAVGVFLTGNPVPTLLADILYSLCDRRGAKKGGQVVCCVPLLMVWFLLHMPEKGPFVEDKSANWLEKLNSLTEKDVRWYSRKLDSPKMLLKCKGFPNVPLIGTRGCINYNPVLATRQLGYAMEGEPEKASLTEFVLKAEDANLDLWNKIKNAWVKIDRTVMGRKNCVAKEAYTQWVKKRVSEIQMPFASVAPTTSQQPEPDPLMTIAREEADALKNQIAQLKKENEEWQFKHFRDQGDIKILKRERDGKEEVIQEYRKKVRDAQAREEKFKEGLASAEESFKAANEKVRKLERSNDIMYNRGNQAMTIQGEWRKKHEEKTQELREAIQKYKDLELGEALERQRREEFHSREKRKDQECIERYEKSLAQLMEAHEDQKNHLAEQIERLEDDLRQHKLAIEVAQQDEKRWKYAFFQMLAVSNGVLDELPERLRVAEVELPLHGVPSGIREFMGYCRRLMTAYKNIVKKAKKRF